uniref:uncharacterized protein LOC118539871 n=1 Tax=Halichoerus grypus TaxID=9711 RepID=UPI001658D84B|nr:uncharacterized protein LOC118539871 [Halichoerus grypus]
MPFTTAAAASSRPLCCSRRSRCPPPAPPPPLAPSPAGAAGQGHRLRRPPPPPLLRPLRGPPPLFGHRPDTRREGRGGWRQGAGRGPRLLQHSPLKGREGRGWRECSDFFRFRRDAGLWRPTGAGTETTPPGVLSGSESLCACAPRSQLGLVAGLHRHWSGGRGRGVRLPELLWPGGAVTLRRALRSAGIKSVELLSSLDTWVPGPAVVALHKSSSWRRRPVELTLLRALRFNCLCVACQHASAYIVCSKNGRNPSHKRRSSYYNELRITSEQLGASAQVLNQSKRAQTNSHKKLSGETPSKGLLAETIWLGIFLVKLLVL